MLRISQVKHIYPSPGVRGAVQPAASETWNPTSRQPKDKPNHRYTLHRHRLKFYISPPHLLSLLMKKWDENEINENESLQKTTQLLITICH